MDEDALTVELVEATGGIGERDRRAGRVAAIIRRFGGYRWAGIYDVGADEIAVLAWDGPAAPAHPRFPVREGLCGVAVAAAEPVIVGDVTTDPRYLTTHATTRSEIVVPIFAEGHVVGLIDVESEARGAFGVRDRQLLERCAALIAPLWAPPGPDDHEVDHVGELIDPGPAGVTATLPPDLPVPVDDGAADHLPGTKMPRLTLPSTDGSPFPVDQPPAGFDRLILYAYPRTGRPGEASLTPDWETIPGAFGCTAEACGFRDHAADLAALGAAVAGVATQDTDYLREAVERLHLRFPMLSDAGLELTEALRLPTFRAGGQILLRRLTLVVEAGLVEAVFYPVFPPDRHAGEIVQWLRGRAPGAA